MTSHVLSPPWRPGWTCHPLITLPYLSELTVYQTIWSAGTSLLLTTSPGLAPSLPRCMPIPCQCTREASSAALGSWPPGAAPICTPSTPAPHPYRKSLAPTPSPAMKISIWYSPPPTILTFPPHPMPLTSCNMAPAPWLPRV